MLELDHIYCMDCLEGMKQIEDKSIDLVLTDPPYGINKDGIKNDSDMSYYYNSLPIVNRILKENTFFVTFASIGNLPEFLCNTPFRYRWTYIVYINNGMVRGGIGFNRFIMALIFNKGNARMNKPLLDIQEVYTTSKQCKQRFHPTEKRLDVCLKLITAFSKEGDVVCDPFIGSGTTALACKKLHRRFIGFEISPEYCAIAEKRIKNIPERLEKYVVEG